MDEFTVNKESAMTSVQPEDRVCLKWDLPNLFLRRGDVGVVKAKWRSGALEVEFPQDWQKFPIRTLVFAEQLDIVETAPA